MNDVSRTKQHNDTQDNSFFQGKEELPWLGFEPTNALYSRSTS